jgi:hypothetical protein
MTKEHFEALLKFLSASREVDPIEANGEFMFKRHQRIQPIELPSVDGKRMFDDFCSFNSEVPPPNAKINLFDAWNECQRDAEECAKALEADLSIENLRLISRNQLDWQRFWSVRDPNAEMRELLAKRVEKGEGMIAKNQLKRKR